MYHCRTYTCMYYIIYIYLAIVTCMLNVMEIKYLTPPPKKKKKKKKFSRDTTQGTCTINACAKNPNPFSELKQGVWRGGKGRVWKGHNSVTIGGARNTSVYYCVLRVIIVFYTFIKTRCMGRG